MRTTFVACPGGCGGDLWVRYRIHRRRPRTMDSPAEPAEVVPEEWACDEGCDLDEGEVREAVERVDAYKVRRGA